MIRAECRLDPAPAVVLENSTFTTGPSPLKACVDPHRQPDGNLLLPSGHDEKDRTACARGDGNRLEPARSPLRRACIPSAYRESVRAGHPVARVLTRERADPVRCLVSTRRTFPARRAERESVSIGRGSSFIR